MNSPPNSKHCVLIDGNFERYELFTSFHPYSLYRLLRLNGTFTSQVSNEDIWQMMRSPPYIHYHICYNSSSEHIDEYYKILKVNYPGSIWLHPATRLEDVVTHKCDHVWVIYGCESSYENLLEKLRLQTEHLENIFSYSWVENLSKGSNRIEYLVR